MCYERSGTPLRANVATNTPQERIDVEWFEQTLWECEPGELHHRCVCGHEHNRHMRQIMVAQMCHDVEPAQAREMEIQ